MHRHNEDVMPDPEQIKEILDVVSEKVPELLKELSGVLYSPEQAKQFGLAGATFYKTLKEAGMSDEQAFMLTNKYMSTLNFGSTMEGFAQHAQHAQHARHGQTAQYGHHNGNSDSSGPNFGAAQQSWEKRNKVKETK
jgi:hypothetical protein